jgi:SAM-dependent methyltransferase
VHAFAHYLEAKRTVDDRALNRRILERLRVELGAVDEPAVADVGAGTGTGIERLLAWGVVQSPRYTAVERDSALVDIARSRLERRIGVEPVPSTLEAFAANIDNHARFDLVIAHAFLDIVDLAPALRDLLALARPGGLLYLPITYDGETIFEPPHVDDELVLASYHRAMDATGSSKTGRRLFRALEDENAEILEVGASDWIVHPEGDTYPNDEAFFLESILSMFERTVGAASQAWVSARRRQILTGQLMYVAHQLDYLARRPR